MRPINADDVLSIVDDLRDRMTVVGYWSVVERVKALPSAQPELIEQGAYVRGFEQGRTQGMIDKTIKAEWTNADALDLQPTCNRLATDCISRQAAIEAIKTWGLIDGLAEGQAIEILSDEEKLPSAQPETAKRIVGKSRDGMTLWYQCDMCNEPVDAQDNFCRGCGRRLIDE